MASAGGERPAPRGNMPGHIAPRTPRRRCWMPRRRRNRTPAPPRLPVCCRCPSTRHAATRLDAETPEKLHAGLAALTGLLRLPEQAAADDAARIEAALAWLNANPGWFLILDNVDTEPALDAANRLLGRVQGGHVLLTS